MYAPTFDKVADQYKDQVEFLNINVDEDTTGLAAEYKVKSIPYTVLVREDGTQLNKTGILSEIELQELILS
jgi:thioredoxin-like negative regulator of GroEL